MWRLGPASCLEQFWRLELVGGPTRSRWRQIHHRLMADPFVQALDDHRSAAGGLLQLREAHHNTKADDERQYEQGARRQPLKRAEHNLLDVGGVHRSVAADPGWASGTS